MTQPATAEGLLAWTPGSGLTRGLAADTRLLAADSWLLRDGLVRGFERHQARFERACADSGAAASAIAGRSPSAISTDTNIVGRSTLMLLPQGVERQTGSSRVLPWKADRPSRR